MTASQQAVRRYRDLPAYLRQLWPLHRRLRDAGNRRPGVVSAR